MSLRRTLLQLLATVALPVAVPGCPLGCPDHMDSTELIEPVDPMLQALVDDCRRDGGVGPDCEPMCREVIMREIGFVENIKHCELVEDNSTETAATAFVSWESSTACGGRRPSCYTASASRGRTPGDYFAQQARLEAASIRAFLELANMLAAFGAPRMLIEACRRAAGEELVHAVLVGRLATRYGVAPQFHHGVDVPTPSLEQLARANAVEGCVRETWGAMVATWQGRTASDPQVRATMQRIAVEETKHATISRAIDRWAMRRLDAAARARVDAARALARVELAATVTEQLPERLVEIAGLPRPEIAAGLLRAMHDARVI